MRNLSTYQLIERISMLIRADERRKCAALGLQPIHLQVLEYLQACNSYSNTPAAVAEYFELTKGTVSQSLQVLERKGYIQKTVDATDGRIIHLHLTADGLQLLAELDVEDFVAEAEQSVLSKKFENLTEALTAMLNGLQKANQTKSFGSCNTCANFDIEDNHFICSETKLPVFQAETHKLCREHVSVKK